MSRRSGAQPRNLDKWMKTGPCGPREWVTPDEAAEVAEVGSTTVRRWVTAGKVHAFKRSPRRMLVDLAMVREQVRPQVMGDESL